MDETDVRCEIANSFPQFSIFPDFAFLKVVDDTLIEPKVEEWNYKTLKQVAGQGPIYVRSNTRLQLCDKQSDASIYDEDSTEEDEDKMINENISFVKTMKRQYFNLPEQLNNTEAGSSRHTTSEAGSSKKLCRVTPIEDYFCPNKTRISCPICFQYLQISEIEAHGNVCAQKFDWDVIPDQSDNEGKKINVLLLPTMLINKQY